MSQFDGKLELDTTDLVNSDNVGAYVRSSDGTLIDHLTIATIDRLAVDSTMKDGSGNNLSSTGGSLDVNVTNAGDIQVAVNSEYAEDSASADAQILNGVGVVREDSLASNTSATGDWTWLKSDSLGRLYVNAFVSSAQVSGDVADDAADSGNPVKIGYRAINAALSALSAANDRSDAISDLYRRQYVNKSAAIAIKNTNQSIGTTAAELAATPLAGRIKMNIQNNGGGGPIYVGGDNLVTSANGTKIKVGGNATIEVGEHVNVWCIATSASADIRILEEA